MGRLGFLGSGVKQPGLRIRIPVFQKMFKVDLRTRIQELMPQDVMTADNVATKVSAVMYFRVVDAEAAVLQVLHARGPALAPPVRDGLAVRPHRGGGGGGGLWVGGWVRSQKKVCVPKIDLQFRAPLIDRSKIF